jgi:hypothetical protein
MSQDLRERYIEQAQERATHYRIFKMLKDHERQSGIVAISFILFWTVFGIAVVIYLYPYVMDAYHFFNGIFG